MNTTLPPAAEMERACTARDADYDGVFVLAVRTTGIFCRPSCPARRPNPENVEYFASVGEALFAGYRPCKRCRPLEANGTVPGWAAGLIAEIERDPAVVIGEGELRRRGLEPARVRRFFQRRFGMTFHAYRRAHRLGRALEAIRDGVDATSAGFDAGWESASGFRDAFVRAFGCAPGSSDGVRSATVAWIPSPVGPLIAGAVDQGICLLEFTDRRALETQLETLRKRLGMPLLPGRHPHLARLEQELGEYFSGDRRVFEVPLHYPGSPFQQVVWDELRRIPYGETRCYEDLAVALGRPGAQRAVGHANGQNRVAILIPCHRVIAKDGGLGGYGGGLWRKRFLLDLEQGQPVQESLFARADEPLDV